MKNVNLSCCLCLYMALLVACGTAEETPGDGPASSSNDAGHDAMQGDTDAPNLDSDAATTAQDVFSGADVGHTDVDGNAAPAQLAGTWGQQVVTSSLATVPIVGEVTTTITSTQVLTITADPQGPDWLVSTSVCTIDTESSESSVRTIIPDAFVDSLPTTTRSLTLNDATVEFPRFVELRGVRLDDIENDALPETSSDSRVFDQDGDGNPGVTVRVTGLIDGDIYLIQRGWNRLHGSLTAAGQLDGLVEWGDEQVILGSNNLLLRNNQPESQPDPVAAKSYFRTSRMNSGADCDDLLAQGAELFSR